MIYLALLFLKGLLFILRKIDYFFAIYCLNIFAQAIHIPPGKDVDILIATYPVREILIFFIGIILWFCLQTFVKIKGIYPFRIIGILGVGFVFYYIANTWIKIDSTIICVAIGIIFAGIEFATRNAFTKEPVMNDEADVSYTLDKNNVENNLLDKDENLAEILIQADKSDDAFYENIEGEITPIFNEVNKENYGEQYKTHPIDVTNVNKYIAMLYKIGWMFSILGGLAWLFISSKITLLSEGDWAKCYFFWCVLSVIYSFVDAFVLVRIAENRIVSIYTLEAVDEPVGVHRKFLAGIIFFRQFFNYFFGSILFGIFWSEKNLSARIAFVVFRIVVLALSIKFRIQVYTAFVFIFHTIPNLVFGSLGNFLGG